MLRNISSLIIFVVSLISFVGCSSVPMNDFFGIEMPPESADRFRIVSYSDINGTSYTSDFTMNPRVYAYAQLKVEEIWIKVVNNDKKPLLSTYTSDEFYLQMKDGTVYVLLKGEREEYPEPDYIPPGGERQFRLYLPKNFWETLGMTRPFKNYTYEMWHGANNLSFFKEEIKEIKVVLGGKTTIILKPIPQNT